jgi:OPA family sugar phosphate sensor protein UhpC-like MFS transporter
LILFLLGFFLAGPQTLIGMAAAELSNPAVTGTAIGAIGLFSGVGASFAGYPLSFIIQSYGWATFLSTLGLMSFSCFVILLFTVKLEIKR